MQQQHAPTTYSELKTYMSNQVNTVPIRCSSLLFDAARINPKMRIIKLKTLDPVSRFSSTKSVLMTQIRNSAKNRKNFRLMLKYADY
jgi:hypothetical protein